MKMSATRRFCCLLLVCILASFCLLTACTTEDPSTSEPATSTASVPTAPTSEYKDADGNYVARTSGQTYNGATITFLAISVNPTYTSEIIKNDPNSPYASSEQLPDVINNALGQRVALVEERLGVKIEEEFLHDPQRKNGKLAERVRLDAIDGKASYQVIMPCLYDAATLSQEGYLINLYSLPGIQMEAPWWDQVFNKECTIAGQLYFTIGDIGTGNKSASAALMFNLQMYKDYGMEQKYGGLPYDLVRNGTWTIDKALEMMREVGEDLTDDGSIDYDDKYGWGGSLDDMWSLFYGANAKLASTDTADGYPALTAYSERNSTVIEKMQTLVQDRQHYVSANDYFNVVQWPSVLLRDNFIAGKSLFYAGTLSTPIELGDMEDKFGMVPIPKGDEQQEEYRSLVNPWVSTCFAVPKTLPDEDRQMMSDVLNEMGAVSANIVSKAYLEQCLEYMKTRDDETIEMIENYILPGRGCDIGMIFAWGGLDGLLQTMASQQVGTFSSNYQALEGAAKSALEETVAFFRNNGNG